VAQNFRCAAVARAAFSRLPPWARHLLARRRLAAIAALICAIAAFHSPALASPFDGEAPPAQHSILPQTPLVTSLLEAQRAASRRLNEAIAGLRDGRSPSALGVALLLAFLYGAFHAAGPGHGKAVVVGYLLSRDAKLWNGIMLGGKIAATHVASALAVVLALEVAFAGHGVPSLEDMRVVRVGSAAAIVGIGFLLLWGAWRRGSTECGCREHEHEHESEHAQDRARDRAHGTIASVVAGIVPCTGALLVMFFCIGNGMLLTGLALLGTIGIGMAVAMGALGAGAVLLRGRVVRLSPASPGHEGAVARALRFAGPAFVIAVGAALVALNA
jgi:ABC-type nickel/cobalt efflux system permease component RcnA